MPQPLRPVNGSLRGSPVDDIAAALTRQKIPFTFVTGCGNQSLPLPFRHATILSKPFSREQLVGAAVHLVEQPKGLGSHSNAGRLNASIGAVISDIFSVLLPLP
jgi:hypothetical protein